MRGGRVLQPEPAGPPSPGSAPGEEPSPPRRGLPVVAALVGLLAVGALLVLAVRAGVGPKLHPPAWLGVGLAATTRGHRGATAAAIVLAAAALVAAWSVLHRRSAEGGLRAPFVVGVALLWTVPLALGPPLLSTDVYSYAAIGRLVQAGLDPYRVGPAALGPGAFLGAVQPVWRHTPTPYGPVLVEVLHGAAVLGGGSVLRTVVVLRICAVLATAAAVFAAVRVARPSERAAVLLVTALNPLVLLHLYSGAHLDALLGVAAIGVVVLTWRDRPHLAVVLAVVAAMVKAPALVLVGFVLLHVLRHRPSVRRLAGVLAAGAGALGVLWLVLPHAFGWLRTLEVPGRIANPRVPSTWLAENLAAQLRTVSAGLPFGTVLDAARDAALLVGAGAALVLLWRAAGRSDRDGALRDVGWALLVLALSGPAVYGWYPAWGLFAVAAGSRPRDRLLLVVLSAWICTVGLPQMYAVPSLGQVAVWGLVVLLWAWARPVPLRRPWSRAATTA